MVICGAYVKKSRWCYQAAIKRPVPVPLLDRKQASSGRSRSNRISSKLLPESMARLVKTRLFLLACCLIVVSTLVHAHGGGLDSLGCHHDRKHGGYHCHRGPLAGQSFASKSDAIQALQVQQSGQGSQQPGASHTPSQAQTAPQIDREERTVYVTRTGKKYHGPNCPYLSRSRISISLKEAKEQGYTACSRCGGK